MNSKLWKLLMYNLSTDVVNTFVIIFVNLYIWDKGKSVADIAWFNLSQYLVWSVSHTIGAWVLHKTSMKTVFQFANLFTLSLFLVLSFVHLDSLLAWLILIGSCNGFMKGFSASGKNLGVAAFGEINEFNRYFQYQNLFSKTLQIVTPLMFAVLIHYIDYQGTFYVMCAYSLVLVGITFFIPNNINTNKEPLFKDMLSPFKSKALKYMPLSFLTGGIFSEFQGVFLMVFTFTITENKFGVAMLNVAYSVLILGLIYLNKKLKKVNGVKWLFIGASTAFIGFGMMIFLKDWWLIIANFFIVAGNFYYSTTYYSQQYETMNVLNEIEQKRMLIWRENLLVISRVILLSIIVLIGNITEITMGYIFCGVMIITMFVPFVHKKMLINS